MQQIKISPGRSNSSVATVNANGTVTAVANGTADITATAADGSGKREVQCDSEGADNVQRFHLKVGRVKSYQYGQKIIQIQ